MIFVDDAPLKDDITIIVLKRSAKSEKIYKAPVQAEEAHNSGTSIDDIEEAEELEELEEVTDDE